MAEYEIESLRQVEADFDPGFRAYTTESIAKER